MYVPETVVHIFLQMAQIGRSSDHHLPRSVLHDVYILSVLLSHFYEICSAISSINYVMNTLTYMATLGYTSHQLPEKGGFRYYPLIDILFTVYTLH